MSDNLTFAELDAQHVELLPARTVLSLFSVGTGGKPGADGTPKPSTHSTFFHVVMGGSSSTSSTGGATGGTGGAAGAGLP